MVKKKIEKDIKSGEDMGNRKAAKKVVTTVAQASEGVISTVVDATLLLLFLSAEFGGGGRPGPGGVWRAYDRAYEDWGAVNYESIKRALYTLGKQGLTKTSGRGDHLHAEITKKGKERLKARVPFYDEKRVWDGKIYLVTYDVVEERKSDREVLREHLKKIGCGMLQKSVWLTVYDPSDVLREFIKSRGLTGSVLVSRLGKDGGVGQKGVGELVAEVYDLEELNDRYRKYLNQYSGKKKFSKSAAIFDFLSILRDDPQLPFKLLPDDWAGAHAYKVFRKISTK